MGAYNQKAVAAFYEEKSNAVMQAIYTEQLHLTCETPETSDNT
jgi:hypothetical protein